MGRNRKRGIVKSSKFKTSICTFHINPTGCPFGDRCAFAHGAEELRSEVENTKKKNNRRYTTLNSDAGSGNELVARCGGVALSCGETQLFGIASKETSLSMRSKRRDFTEVVSWGDFALKGTISAPAKPEKGNAATKNFASVNNAAKKRNFMPQTEVCREMCSKNQCCTDINKHGKSKIVGTQETKASASGEIYSTSNSLFPSSMGKMDGLTQYPYLPPGALLLPYLGTIPNFGSTPSSHPGAAYVMCVAADGSQGNSVPCLLPLTTSSVTEMKDLITLTDTSFIPYVALPEANCSNNVTDGGNQHDYPSSASNTVFPRMMPVPLTSFSRIIPTNTFPLYKGQERPNVSGVGTCSSSMPKRGFFGNDKNNNKDDDADSKKDCIISLSSHVSAMKTNVDDETMGFTGVPEWN
ncbi:uncharacterized protein Tco025E_09786 [Trypanosoma conorhini]|uniref:C3H1-type domain-containing protein n=1 Tax=Trypanosoma conorhini TaxID=83891 RepID=A0A3R7K9C4_9TRYP|nr:uncharacterized protein Tco025E_09786 [Trypanosoma conorhini]RNE96193.1 hypothetical protein Tco025E_09786 [Trypanosoma conorhini]